MSKLKIGVIGSGDVGQKLGLGFASRGHEVKLGTRDPKSDKVVAWAKSAAESAGKSGGGSASTGTFAEAASFGDVIVLATAWSGTKSALDMAGAASFRGKVVIDATNPLKTEPGKPPSLAIGHTDSGGEQVQRWLPDARVVKCFNIVGNADMVDPEFPNGPPDMFFCGNDEDAKKTVAEICKSFGWPTIDIGGIDGARLLEPMCILWVLYGVRGGGWRHAFKLLKK